MGAERLIKGQNTTLSSSELAFFLMTTPAGGIDTSAIVLGQNGKVRQESDFVFFNQPDHPSGAVRHVAADALTGVDGVEVAYARFDAGVDRVLITVSVAAGSIRTYSRATLLVRDLTTGEDVYEVDVVGEGAESALVLAEIYRRNGAWKLRGVSQGYESGLAGLATDYGIDVAEPATPGSPAPQAFPAAAPLEIPPPDTQRTSPPAPPAQPLADPAPPVPDPAEVAMVRNLMQQYGQACEAITEHINNAAKVARDAVAARQMADVRPQHEISIRHFANLAAQKERDFSALFEALEGACRRARAIGAQIHAAASTVKVPFDPEMVLMIVLDDQGTYGDAQVGSHVMGADFPASPQAFLDVFERVRHAVEADNSTILDSGFSGYVVGRAQPTSSSSHGVL